MGDKDTGCLKGELQTRVGGREVRTCDGVGVNVDVVVGFGTHPAHGIGRQCEKGSQAQFPVIPNAQRAVPSTHLADDRCAENHIECGQMT